MKEFNKFVSEMLNAMQTNKINNFFENLNKSNKRQFNRFMRSMNVPPTKREQFIKRLIQENKFNSLYTNVDPKEGCGHFKRYCQIYCKKCKKFYTCHKCHDEDENLDHKFDL